MPCQAQKRTASLVDLDDAVLLRQDADNVRDGVEGCLPSLCRQALGHQGVVQLRDVDHDAIDAGRNTVFNPWTAGQVEVADPPLLVESTKLIGLCEPLERSLKAGPESAEILRVRKLEEAPPDQILDRVAVGRLHCRADVQQPSLCICREDNVVNVLHEIAIPRFGAGQCLLGKIVSVFEVEAVQGEREITH